MSSESDKVVSEQEKTPSKTELGPADELRAGSATNARPARAKTKSLKTDGSASPPRSRRAPAKKVAAKSAKGGPPRSRRAQRSEASIPPISTDLDEHGDRIVTDDPLAITPTPPPTAVTLSADDAVEAPAGVPLSRPSISPFVKSAVALAAAVCLVLVGRGFMRHPAPPPQLSAAASAPAVHPVESDPVGDTIQAPTDTLVQESAEGDKNDALEALEQGKLEDAIAAGERATHLDPTDADAWRILGAAYQNQGNVIAARRCYRACTESATRGDTRECTLLLQ